jgi:hypothetical protein
MELVKTFVGFVILFVAVALTFANASASAWQARAIRCGGFPLPYGTFIASIGPSAKEQRPSSVTAVAAVALENSLRAKAWIVWDGQGYAWLGLAKGSPADLRRLWVYNKAPNFAGPGIQVKFTLATKPLPEYLPKKYRLVDCPDAVPYAP